MYSNKGYNNYIVQNQRDIGVVNKDKENMVKEADAKQKSQNTYWFHTANKELIDITFWHEITRA